MRLEDRTVPSASALAPVATVDLGDHYVSGNESISLLQRVGEYGVRVAPGTSIRSLTGRGLFAGFSVEKQIDDTLFILRSENGSIPAGPAGADIQWISPLFQAPRYGSWLVASNELIVSLKPGVDPAAFFAGDNRFSGYRRLTGTPDQFVATIATGAGRNALAVNSALAKDDRLNWSSPNFFQDWQKYFTPNDALYAQQWHLNNTGQNGSTPNADVDAPEAWNVTPGGSPNVNIAVVDDCMEIAHPDLAPNVFVNTNEVPGNGIDDDGNGYIDDRSGFDFTKNTGSLVPSPNDAHATSVGGIAAGRGNNSIGIAGIAYQSKLIAVRIFGDSGGATSDANIASAVYYAAGRTADGTGTFRSGDIMNNSWGGGAPSAAITGAFTWASTSGRGGKGVVSFISSGNGGASFISYPSVLAGSISGVVSVGASTDRNLLANYSQFGPQLDIVAPSSGGNFGTVTTDRQGTLGYNNAAGTAGNYTNTLASSFGGTSSASPLAAGIGALVLARDANLTAAQVRGLMRNTTDLIDPAGASYDATSGFSLKYGYGKANAFAAVSGVGIAKAQVLLGSTIIASGTGSADFGTVTIGGFADVTFRLRNQGAQTLNLTNLGISAGPFSSVGGFASSALAVGQSTTFTIRFSPTAVPAANATVTIASNDPGTPSYTFTVSGLGRAPSIAGTISEDWNGNGVRDANDPGLAGAVAFLDSNGNGERDVAINSYASTDVPKSFGPTSTTSTLTITDVGQVDSIKVTLSINHTWDADVIATLISPTGRRVILFSEIGGNGDDFISTTLDDNAATPIANGLPPFTGSFKPAEPLSSLIGEASNGIWTLELQDVFSFADDGTLTSWQLEVGVSETFVKSDSNGFYAFLGLPAGNYQVGQDPGASSQATGPVASYTLNLPANGSMTGNDFSQNRKNAIYGTQFSDFDSNGVRDPGEPLLPGWTIYRDKNNNGTFDIIDDSVAATGLPLAIPDLGRANSTINVSGLDGAVARVKVTVSIAHTYVEDLTVALRSPDGVRVVLANRVGGTGHNFTNTTFDDAATTPIANGTAPFTGSFKPSESLAALNGGAANGVWTLEVTDNFPGDTGNLISWSLSIGHTEPFEVTNSLGNYRFNPLPAGNYVLRELAQAGFVPTAPVGGAFNVALASGATVVNRDFGVHNTAPAAPTVTGVVIGDGTAQRSRIEQLKVAFSNIITFVGAPGAAFLLEKMVGGSPSGAVTLNVATAVVNGHTEATLTFASDTTFGSLSDGRYRLTVLASQVTNGGTPMAANSVTSFHRYYGDSNNDARVNLADLGLFSTTYGKVAGDPGYLGYFDFNNDGRVNIADYGQISIRYLVTLP